MLGLQVDPGYLTSSLLLWLRLAAVLFLTPIFAGFKGPTSMLVILSLALAGLLSAAWQVPHLQPSLTIGRLFVAGLTEVFVGMVMAFGVHAAFAAFGAAGQIVDLQIGFGAGASFDPITRGNAPVFAAALGSLATVTFFAMDGHHALLRGLAFSVAEIPPGTLPGAMSADAVVRQFGAIFTSALALIAPVFVVLLLLEAGLAVMSRMLPQMNVFFVGMPVKILLGLGVLSATATALPSAMHRTFASIFVFWTQVLR